MGRVFLSVSIVAILLSGCAEIKLPSFVQKQESIRNAVPKNTAPPIVAKEIVAPKPITNPSTKETFKHRWLKKFFRERAQ
jgi:hypothetical protein